MKRYRIGELTGRLVLIPFYSFIYSLAIYISISSEVRRYIFLFSPFLIGTLGGSGRFGF
jgi:hypothetical protein